MRQEPKLSEFDGFDEPKSSSAQPSIIVQKRGPGALVWLLMLLNLGGLGALGYWNLNLQGETQQMGDLSETQTSRLQSELSDAQSRLAQLERATRNLEIVDGEFSGRLDLITGQGVSSNASSIERNGRQLKELSQSLAALTERLDQLMTDLGQNQDQSQSLRGQVTRLATEIETVAVRLGGLDERLAGQQSLIDALSGRFGPLTEALTAQADETSNLQTSLIRVESDISSLQGVTEGLTGQTARLAGRLDQVAARPQATSGPDLTGEVELLQAQLQQQRSEMVRISEDIRSVDAFRRSTLQTINRLEAGLRQVQAQ